MTEQYTLETDEVGIWLIVGGDKQAGHVSWYEIVNRIKAQIAKEEFLLKLTHIDEKLGEYLDEEQDQ